MTTPTNGSAFAIYAAGRRRFLKSAGVAGFGLAGAGLLQSSSAFADSDREDDDDHDRSRYSDIDLLNFALNLEYLEAEFYTRAFYGKTLEEFGIPTGGTGTPGPTTGGHQINFESGGDEDGDGDHDPDDNAKEVTKKLQTIAQQITQDEQNHVLVLRDTLGKHAIAKPAIDLNALGFGFASYQQFLALSRAFEDTGMSAYGGLIPQIRNRKTLSTLARIALIEAYHASNVRLLIALNNVTAEFPVDSIDILPPPNGTQYFPVDSSSSNATAAAAAPAARISAAATTGTGSSLATVRNTSQVLMVLYHSGTQQVASGGFFPNGVNGPINTT